jgi:hypothetical protein
MLYGEELFIRDAAIEGGSPINMNATTGAKYTALMLKPGVVRAFGFVVTTGFDYDSQNAKGVLTLYRYPGNNSANKVALQTLTLEDAIAAKKVVITDVPNVVTNEVPTNPGKAHFNIGDSIVVEITTQATGGTYIAGAFQPFIHYHNRGDSYNAQPQVVNQTPAITGSYGNVG